MWTPAKATPSGCALGVSMERRPAKNATIFIFIFLRFFGRAHPEAGSNRGYVVILACTEAITIAMLMLLQLIWLGAATGTVLVPGYGGMEGGGGGVSVRPNGR